MTNPSMPAGWYPDPAPGAQQGQERFWTGVEWNHDLVRGAAASSGPRAVLAPPPPMKTCTDRQVLVWGGQVADGRLPSVCVLTGLPATSNERKTVQFTPPWVYLGLFGGVILMVVLSAVATRKVPGQLPLSAAGRERLQRRARVWQALLGLTVLAFVGAFALSSGPLLGVGAVLVLATLVAVSLAASWAPAWVSPDRQVVQLRKVHPDFARAVREQYGLAG